jgi:TPP-dependent pyruvate/acetoin dehydrogenase alpha subunit
MTTHTPQTLSAFSQRVRDAFIAKRIPGPVHLCDDAQADDLVRIFRDIKPEDWVFATWRSSFHALLKGIPEEEVFQMILDGRSMYLMSKEYRFFASSIVGGILPIALGVAEGIKRNGGGAWCRVFVGDMCKTTGLYSEFVRYVEGHQLPVVIISEDNGLSTNTPTREAWGTGNHHHYTGYAYKRTVPHVGVGERVQF